MAVRLILVDLVLVDLPPLRTVIGVVALHRTVSHSACIQTWMTAVLGRIVACLQQAVKFIQPRLLDAKDEKPSIAFEVGYPFQILKFKIESAYCTSPDRNTHSFKKWFSVLGIDLQGPRQRHMKR
jgi:hypothetical protein